MPCSNGKDSYEVTRVPAHLIWPGCDYSKNPAEAVMGDRSLSGAELASVSQALSKVRVSSAKNCGADAAVLTLDVTRAADVTRYAHDFYSDCPWEAQAGRTFATGSKIWAACCPGSPSRSSGVEQGRRSHERRRPGPRTPVRRVSVAEDKNDPCQCYWRIHRGPLLDIGLA